eukprot:gene7108-7912_t
MVPSQENVEEEKTQQQQQQPNHTKLKRMFVSRQRKRKLLPSKNKGGDETIDSDSDIVSDNDDKDEVRQESDDSTDETAQEKKVRLAKEYIEKLENEERLKSLDQELDRDAIAHRLKEDVLEEKGFLQKNIANQFIGADMVNMKVLRGHKLSVTCVIISHDHQHIFSGSKDGTIIKWNINSGLKVHRILGLEKSHSKDAKGYEGHVSCLAISTDGQFLSSGGKEKNVFIWNADDMSFIRQFTGHRDSITGLAFRKGTHQLFSASKDRSIKVWNLDEMSYIETLFGHEDSITGIDSLTKDRAVTSGGRDRTVRLWKIPEESQLVFRGQGASTIDCVAMINEEHSVSGADDGSLSIWNIHKKKPLVTVRNAHKIDASLNLDCKESWVTCVAAVKNGDLIASAGSCDSCIRLWKCENHFRSLKPHFAIPMVGFVNAVAFSQDGSRLIAAIGQEHRLGRWWRLKQAKNCISIIPLLKSGNQGES